MTVKELREALAGLPDDMPVILQKDAEGNGFSPLDGASGDNNSYEAESTWSGRVGFTRLTKQARAKGFTMDDVVDGVPCVVLWPVI